MDNTAKTRILTVDPQHPDPELIRAAADVLRSGRLVAFPTETVYGLGSDALNSEAIARIYRAKRRPANDPVIAHIHEVEQLTLLAVDIPQTAHDLAEAFWPGPLTLVLTRAASVPENIATGLPTIAVRMPRHPVGRALLHAFGKPIAAPSANTFTRPSATTAAHVLEDLRDRVDMVLDGGAANIGLESTVIDMTQTPPVLLRPGGLLLADIRRVVPGVIHNTTPNSDKQSPSPGMMTKHYSPRARVMLFDGPLDVVQVAMCDTATRLISNQKRVGILTTEENAEVFTNLGARIISLGKRDDLETIGRVLFGAMRALDQQRADVILVHGFGQEGLGVVIWDRLLRAAEGNVINVE